MWLMQMIIVFFAFSLVKSTSLYKSGNWIPNPPLNIHVKPSKPETGGGEVKEDVKEVKESTCACGRTDVQEPIHFDYTSRLALTGI